MRYQLLGLLMAELLASGALAADLPSWLTERRIIGHNDLEPIEGAADTALYDQALIVARVETSDGMGFCTASRVGDDLFLTNHHCLDFKDCDGIRLHLGYERAMAPQNQLMFRCKEVLSKSLTYDYALLRAELVGSAAGGGGKRVTYRYRDLNIPIPDNNSVGITQTFSVKQSGPIVGLLVRVKIDHPEKSELRLTLTSPAGKMILLSGDFSDQAATDPNLLYLWAGSLSAFKGTEAAGVWRLNVVDTMKENKGSLQSASLTVTTESEEQEQTTDLKLEDYPVAILSAATLRDGQMLAAPGHPEAHHKEVDRGGDCKFRSAKVATMNERQCVTHLCDTEGGSSGTPLLDRETGEVVALHWGGTDDYNMAIPMSLIIKDLKQHLKSEDFDQLTINE